MGTGSGRVHCTWEYVEALEVAENVSPNSQDVSLNSQNSLPSKTQALAMRSLDPDQQRRRGNRESGPDADLRRFTCGRNVSNYLGPKQEVTGPALKYHLTFRTDFGNLSLLVTDVRAASIATQLGWVGETAEISRHLDKG